MHLTPGVFFLGVIDECVHVALERPIAARRVRVEPTAHLHGEVGRLLHRLDGEIFRRMDDYCPLATDPRDDRGPIFVVVPPPGLTFLAAPPRAASQCLLPALACLALLSSHVIQLIRLHSTLHLPIRLVGDSRIAQPPAPAIARPTMDPQLSRNTSR